MEKAVAGRAKGGVEKAKKQTAEERKALSKKMLEAKAELAKLPRATHGSSDHPLKIGDVEIPCYVLADGTRVLSQRGLQTGLGMSLSGPSKAGEQRVSSFLLSVSKRSNENNELSARSFELSEKLKTPIIFIPPKGGRSVHGYEATLLADICDVILEARKIDGALHPQQSRIAEQCEILMRGFARVGIIALIDEATGFQKDRAKDALAKILEAFVAKEIQPYLKTFPAEYYEQLFRLYGYTFPPENKRPQWRPAFFGTITNEVVYNRLAPDLLPELKKAASKSERRAKLHQWLTNDIGHPKLREHLASIVSILKLSKTPAEFKANVNVVHPRYGDNKQLDFDEPNNE